MVNDLLFYGCISKIFNDDEKPFDLYIEGFNFDGKLIDLSFAELVLSLDNLQLGDISVLFLNRLVELADLLVESLDLVNVVRL